MAACALSTWSACVKALTMDAPEFKPEQRWEWCMRQVVSDTACWRRELE